MVRDISCNPLRYWICGHPQATTFWCRSLHILVPWPSLKYLKTFILSCSSQLFTQLQPWAQLLFDTLGRERYPRKRCWLSSVHGIVGILAEGDILTYIGFVFPQRDRFSTFLLFTFNSLLFISFKKLFHSTLNASTRPQSTKRLLHVWGHPEPHGISHANQSCGANPCLKIKIKINLNRIMP